MRFFVLPVCAFQGLSSAAQLPPGKQRLVSAADLYLAYCAFGAGRRANDVFTAHYNELLGVENHKFITFGVVQVSLTLQSLVCL